MNAARGDENGGALGGATGAVVVGAASPWRKRCGPVIRVAPRPWIPDQVRNDEGGAPDPIFVPKTETARKDGLDPTAEEIGVVTREYQERQRLSMRDAGG